MTLDNKLRNKVITLKGLNRSINAIAKECGIDRDKVNYITRPELKKVKYDTQENKRMYILYCGGHTFTSIGLQFGIDRHRLSKLLKGYGEWLDRKTAMRKKREVVRAHSLKPMTKAERGGLTPSQYMMRGTLFSTRPENMENPNDDIYAW